jgi:hypothetical protein
MSLPWTCRLGLCTHFVTRLCLRLTLSHSTVLLLRSLNLKDTVSPQKGGYLGVFEQLNMLHIYVLCVFVCSVFKQKVLKMIFRNYKPSRYFFMLTSEINAVTILVFFFPDFLKTFLLACISCTKGAHYNIYICVYNVP